MWFLWGDKVMEPSCSFYGGIRLWSHHVVSMGDKVMETSCGFYGG